MLQCCGILASGRFSIGENLMEWILWAVLAVMLALLCYTTCWTSAVIIKKVQPVTDSFFDALELFIRLKPNPKKTAPANHSPAETQREARNS